MATNAIGRISLSPFTLSLPEGALHMVPFAGFFTALAASLYGERKLREMANQSAIGGFQEYKCQQILENQQANRVALLALNIVISYLAISFFVLRNIQN